MKIHFLVFDIYGMGGTVRTVLNVTNYLAQKGYDIEIISVFKHHRVPFFEIDPSIKVTVLHDVVNRNRHSRSLKTMIANRITNMKSYLIHKDDEAFHFFSLLSDIKMRNYIQTIDSGIIVSTRPSFNIFVSRFAHPNVKIIGQEHLNFSIHPEGLKSEILRCYPKLDYLATLTDEDTIDYEKLLANGKVKVKKITNSIPPLAGVISNLESKSIIAAGRLVEQKGFDLLIEAFEKVNNKFPDWKLKIYGSGGERFNLEKLINEKHLYNHVLLMGATKRIDLELANSSIYALSSRFEGFGMVIVEAMQCGVPVVSFDCPKGPSEIIKHEEDGLLVENGNVDAFANALMELIENEQKRKRFGKNAIENVKRFEINQIGRIWESTLKEVAKIGRLD